jgi:hypothetical protein
MLHGATQLLSTSEQTRRTREEPSQWVEGTWCVGGRRVTLCQFSCEEISSPTAIPRPICTGYPKKLVRFRFVQIPGCAAATCFSHSPPPSAAFHHPNPLPAHTLSRRFIGYQGRSGSPGACCCCHLLQPLSATFSHLQPPRLRIPTGSWPS